MNSDIIKSYLVELGYDVDKKSLNTFNDALRSAGQMLAKFTSGAATQVAEVGLGITAALTAVATGTIAMMGEVAKSDLGFQIMARRMFMTTDAAKQMKIGLDALGYSVEEVIWGPPELQHRYRQLIDDQKKLNSGLGGSSFETEMRKIRDIEFEFTRLKVEAQYFVMGLTKALSKALTGDENGLLQKLRGWNEWLIKNIPELASRFSNYLVPILKDVKAIWADIGDVLQIVGSLIIGVIGTLYDDPKLKGGATNIDTVGTAFTHLSHSIRVAFDWLNSLLRLIYENHAVLVGLGVIRGGLSGAAFGSAFGPWGTVAGAIGGGIAGGYATDYLTKGIHPIVPTAEAQEDVRRAAVEAGLDPALMLSLAHVESGFKSNALSNKGAMGLMQLMPDTARGLGVTDPYDPVQNASGGTREFARLLKKYGNVKEALEAYNWGEGKLDRNRGHAPKEVEDYANSVMSGAKAYAITVNVNVNTNASPEQIGQHVSSAVRKELKEAAQRDLVQGRGGVRYA